MFPNRVLNGLQSEEQLREEINTHCPLFHRFGSSPWNRVWLTLPVATTDEYTRRIDMLFKFL